MKSISALFSVKGPLEHVDPVYDFGTGLMGDEATGYGPRSSNDKKLEEYYYLIGDNTL